MILWLLLGCFGSSVPAPTPREPGADARVGAAARGDGDRDLGAGLPEGMEGAASPMRSQQCAFTSSNICFLPVPRATLRMGAQASDPEGLGHDPDASPDEGPVRQIEVAPFWIHKHEVTAVEYRRCLEGGGCKPESVQSSGPLYTLDDPDKRSHPVNGVTWEGAAAYCAWVGGRLPTEAEWELAARGTDGRRFPWGNEPACGTAASRQQGVWSREMNRPPCKNSGTLVVSDMRGSSPYDLVGMAGNVLEWVADPYAEGLRGLRGGSWIDVEASDLRSTMRHALPPGQKLPDVGFRCAL